MEIEARDLVLRVSLNGEFLHRVDMDALLATLPNVAHDHPSRNRRGRIALQNLGGTVHFRNLRVKELARPEVQEQPAQPSAFPRGASTAPAPAAPVAAAEPMPREVDAAVSASGEADFFVTIQQDGKPGEKITKVREAIARLDEWSAAGGGGEATVKLFAARKSFKTPQEARQGLETMLLAGLDAAGRRYGVSFVATEVNAARQGASLKTTPPNKDDTLVFGLEVMRFLAGYSPDAIQRMGLKQVVLCDEALLNGQPFPSGGGALGDSLVLGLKGFPPEMVVRLHHELYHVFESTAWGARASTDEEWMALNPAGFSYPGYAGFFDAQGKARLEEFAKAAPEGFVNAYAASAVTEDKAETYFMMRAMPQQLQAQLETDLRLRAKVELIERRVRALGPEFQPGFWKK
jgi:hypothetical protein